MPNVRNLRVYTLSSGTRSYVMQVDGAWLDLSAHLASRSLPIDLGTLVESYFFARDNLERSLGQGSWPEAQPVFGEFGLDLPVPRERVGKILALGKNFQEHAAEFREKVPEEPMFFNKLPETLVPSGASVRVQPWYDGRVDHESELCVVIGRSGSCIPAAQALEYVAGYTVANDLTARSLQGKDRELKYPWFRGKNMDGFCPLGPCFVPRDFLDTRDLKVQCRVNGELRQDASTKDLVVGIPQAIEWLSKHLTLRPFDLVLMGTPAGVGPLGDGDEVECSISGIGKLTTRILRPNE
ncbi:MAG: fumarylacetoacetate hydrolase family protein [Planctomycetes bacterium]|nr:fumarylacetoacetate hydrolase family protein [Planctomycetota bacterium]